MANKFTSHTSANLVPRDKQVSPAKPTGQTFDVGGEIKVVRQQTTVETYDYIGMTEAAADTCVDAIVALSTGTTTYDARKQRVGDSDMWDVAVTKTELAIDYYTITTTTTTTAA